MSWGWESARGRLLSRAGLGIVSHVVTPGLVEEAVGDGLAREMRVRSLPSLVGAYFVLGLCLFSAEPYAEVLRKLTAGLREALAAAGWKPPAVTALTGVRRRLGNGRWSRCPRGWPGRAARGGRRGRTWAGCW